MYSVRITAIRQTVYTDLMAKYENPIEHTCDIREGEQWISVDGQRPDGLCPSAWESMKVFVESLARGDGNFYDGFRPFSFYLETIHEDKGAVLL